MSSSAETFLVSLGAWIESSIPWLDGRVSYLYRNDTAMAHSPIGPPWLNLQWLMEDQAPMGNQYAGLSIVDASIQADLTIAMPSEDYSGAAMGVLMDAAADLRVAIVEAWKTHHGGAPIGAVDWLSLGNIQTDFGVLRSAMGADQAVISVRPAVKIRRAYNGR